MSQSGRAVKKSIVGNQNTLKKISIAIAVTGPVSPIDPQFEYYTYRMKEVFGSIGKNVIIFQKISDMAFYLLDPPPSLVCQIAHQSLATIRNLSRTSYS